MSINVFFRPKLGTEKRPITVNVQNEQRAGEIAAMCNQHAWKYIIGLEPDKPENIDPLQWVNRKYAEDKHWYISVTKFLMELENSIL